MLRPEDIVIHKADKNLEKIIDEIPDDFNILVLGNRTQLDDFPDGRVFKLSTPLQKNDLICSVDM